MSYRAGQISRVTDLPTIVDADTGFGVPSLSLSRYITNGFSIGAQYSLNSLDIKNTNIDFSSLDAIVKYKQDNIF